MRPVVAVDTGELARSDNGAGGAEAFVDPAANGVGRHARARGVLVHLHPRRRLAHGGRFFVNRALERVEARMHLGAQRGDRGLQAGAVDHSDDLPRPAPTSAVP
ncbi:MAG: hypothetical protein KF764_25445 [Labilithrix sp.]|nr:hypothetical protein [Labilithrix sp.]